MAGRGAKSDAAVRREASDWVALIHDADAAVDRAAFERWCAEDPRHPVAYARAERAWESAALLAKTKFGRDRGLPERQRAFNRPALGYALAAAGVILVAAIIGLSVAARGWSHPDRTADETEVASNLGQIRKVALPDGSAVTLDTASVLRVAFTNSERRLYLARGRARFDVAHDAARPFIVMAGDGSVTAHGTVFDVAVLGDKVQVLLLRGSVDVSEGRTTAASAAATRRLNPGQKISFGAIEPLALAQAANPIDGQWVSGMLSFDRTPLAEAIVEANRYSAAKISLADPALGVLRITGAYHAGDAVGLAQRIAESLDLQASRTAQGNVLISRPTAAPAT